MNNRRLIIYSSIVAAILMLLAGYLVFSLFSDKGESGASVSDPSSSLLYKAIPSDAVAVVTVERGDYLKSIHMYGDNPSLTNDGAMALSMHYSAKNEVSLLWIARSGDSGKGEEGRGAPVAKYKGKRAYSSVEIYETDKGVHVASYGGLKMWSTSPYVVESSIRHLKNETSILDNNEFVTALKSLNSGNKLVVNHHQIGKFFSGVVQRDFLKYSDFFLRLSSWSLYELKPGDLILNLAGLMVNNGEERYFSSLFAAQQPQKGEYASILPAQTAFALSMPFESHILFLDGYKGFLEVHKKLNNYNYQQHIVSVEWALSPKELADSLDIKEAVAAFCSFGNSYKWVTLLRVGQESSIVSDMISSLLDKEKEIKVDKFKYKGYISSLLGPFFGKCDEESICKVGNWYIVGPEDFVRAFAVGANKFFTLKDYLEQTPLKEFAGKECNVDIYANISFMQDSVVKIFKPQYSERMLKRSEKSNFAVATARISSDKDFSVKADLSLCIAKLEKLPEPPAVEEDAPVVVVDSTIVVENGTFELEDFVNGGKCYLQQSDNLSLRYLNGKKKGVWTIPFSEPLCGRVGQVDFFSNNKLQMLFATSDKLYLLDRLGRIVRGFPMKLHQKIVLGPELYKEGGSYGFVTLNGDNTIAIYKLTRGELAKPVIIDAGEFVKELPYVKSAGGVNYLFVKTLSQIKIYAMNGNQITGKEKKRRIAPDSELVINGSFVEYTGRDSKQYVLDLQTGKSRVKKK